MFFSWFYDVDHKTFPGAYLVSAHFFMLQLGIVVNHNDKKRYNMPHFIKYSLFFRLEKSDENL